MASTASFPRKLFYKINEVAEIVGVEAYVLRYWETKFPMLKPERYGNDERRYRAKDIELLLRVRSLLYDEKFTIAGAVDRIRKDPHGNLDAVEPRNVIDIASHAPETVATDGGGTAQLEFLADEQVAVDLGPVRQRLADIRLELVQLRNSMA